MDASRLGTDRSARVSLTFLISIAEFDWSIELRNVEQEAAALLRPRLDCFLKPRAKELLTYVERQTGSPIPNRIDAIVSGTDDLAPPAQWHEHWRDGLSEGRRVVESMLVQLTQQTVSGTGDYRDWHRVACGALVSIVDPNFICALDFLW